MNFLPKIKKAKLIFNNWLQRDLSFLGRVLLINAEGLSHFLYPSFSLFVHDNTCKQINNLLFKVFWKNKHQHLKKQVLCGKKADEGFDMLDFFFTLIILSK